MSLIDIDIDKLILMGYWLIGDKLWDKSEKYTPGISRLWKSTLPWLETCRICRKTIHAPEKPTHVGSIYSRIYSCISLIGIMTRALCDQGIWAYATLRVEYDADCLNEPMDIQEKKEFDGVSGSPNPLFNHLDVGQTWRTLLPKQYK